MTGYNDSRLSNEPAFKRLRALRARLSTVYSMLVLGLFALFVAASTLFPEAMTTSVADHAPFSVAMLAALLMVVLPVLLAAVFLKKTDRDIEPLRAELAKRRETESNEE